MKTSIAFLIGLMFCFFSCHNKKENTTSLSLAPLIVKAHGYVVPKDSMAEPKMIPAGDPKVVIAGEPKVVVANTNVQHAGIPKIVVAGVPRVCTPGQDSFSLPKTVPAIGNSIMA